MTRSYDGPWDSDAFERLEAWDPSWAAACNAVAADPWRSGVLSQKFVELVSLAVSVACTSLNADATRRHIRRALDAGDGELAGGAEGGGLGPELDVDALAVDAAGRDGGGFFF